MQQPASKTLYTEKWVKSLFPRRRAAQVLEEGGEPEARGGARGGARAGQGREGSEGRADGEACHAQRR